jgi:signal transduction histidine kinase
MLYLVRLRQATEELQRRLGSRMEERERIARELHDTLLQGFQGLILRFQAVLKSLPADQPARYMMGEVLDRADEVMLKGRQSVRDLRERGSSITELSDALLQCGNELTAGHTSHFDMVIVGDPRPLGPIVFDEAYRIGREALINAFQHSNAPMIEAELMYTRSQVSLKVRDNGDGIDGDILSRGRAGHWGLSGMRERAHKIGGKVTIWSSPGAGTEIELTIPAKVAYFGVDPQTLWQRLKRLFGRAEETRL